MGAQGLEPRLTEQLLKILRGGEIIQRFDTLRLTPAPFRTPFCSLGRSQGSLFLTAAHLFLQPALLLLGQLDLVHIVQKSRTVRLGIILMPVQIEILAHSHRVDHQTTVFKIDNPAQCSIVMIHRLGDLLAHFHLLEVHLVRKTLGMQYVLHTGSQRILLEHVQQLLDDEVGNLFQLRMTILDVFPILKLLTSPARRTGIHIATPLTLIEPHILLILVTAIQLSVDLT